MKLPLRSHIREINDVDNKDELDDFKLNLYVLNCI